MRKDLGNYQIYDIAMPKIESLKVQVSLGFVILHL